MPRRDQETLSSWTRWKSLQTTDRRRLFDIRGSSSLRTGPGVRQADIENDAPPSHRDFQVDIRPRLKDTWVECLYVSVPIANTRLTFRVRWICSYSGHCCSDHSMGK